MSQFTLFCYPHLHKSTMVSSTHYWKKSKIWSGVWNFFWFDCVFIYIMWKSQMNALLTNLKFDLVSETFLVWLCIYIYHVKISNECIINKYLSKYINVYKSLYITEPHWTTNELFTFL